MFSIEQSHFLQALGRAIGNSLWQLAALWLVYAAISSIGKLTANRKYHLATGTSLAGFALFVGTLVHAYVTLPLHPSLSGIYTEAASDAGSSLPDHLFYLYHSISQSIQSLAPYISCAYLFLFVVLTIRLGNGFRQVQFFATQGLEKTNVEWRLFIQQHATALGISRKVQIFASQHVQSPLTLGFWKPIILMPVASLSHLTIAQVESILLHELAHIHRHDYLINIFLQIAEITLFFNPFMRLLLRQVKQERENSCDDYVLQFQYSPKDYAKALLAIEHSNNTTLLALAAKGNQSFQLLNRVKRMVAPQPKAFNYRQQLGMLLLFTVLTLGFTIIIPHPKKATSKTATAVAKKISIVKLEAPVAIAEMPEAANYPPAPPPAFDIVKEITHYQHIAKNLDEKTIEANARKMKLKEAELEAIGKEMEEKMKPVTAQLEAWGNSFSNMENNGTPGDVLALSKLEELKNIPMEGITTISQEYQKKLISKVDELMKIIPFSTRINDLKKLPGFAVNWQRNAATLEDAKEKGEVIGRADYARKGAAVSNFILKNAQRLISAKALNLKIAQAQTAAKQQEILAQADRLNLGLFTDDRDSSFAKANSLLAKVQNHTFPEQPVQFSSPLAVQPYVQVNNKHLLNGKCVITVSDNDIKVTTEDSDPNLPASININGQNIDIRHEKQVNNGKQEKVIIININSLN